MDKRKIIPSKKGIGFTVEHYTTAKPVDSHDEGIKKFEEGVEKVKSFYKDFDEEYAATGDERFKAAANGFHYAGVLSEELLKAFKNEYAISSELSEEVEQMRKLLNK